jgi:HSP20 family protein
MLMRPYRGWRSTEREIERLRREMNRLFADWPARADWRAAPRVPAMNVWTDENSAVLTAELPGVSIEDVDISVERDTLTLRGERRREEMEEAVTYHRRERRFGGFHRAYRLPFQVDAGQVQAELKNGMLSILLPRAEADKPKKIAVKAG